MADDRLNKYVEKALSSGKDPNAVSATLKVAGWPEDEILMALDAWDVVDGTAVPRRRKTIAELAGISFQYLLLFATFFMGAGGLLDVLFGFINSNVPPLDGYANYDIKWGVVTLAVSFPVYAFMYLKTSRAAQSDPDHRSSPARRWLIYLTLLVAAIATITGVINIGVGLLEGRGDTNGGLKLATMVSLAVATFLNYLWELRRSSSKPGALRNIFLTAAVMFISGSIASGITFSLKHREPPPQYIQLQPGMKVTFPDGSNMDVPKDEPSDAGVGEPHGPKPVKEPPPAPQPKPAH